MLFYVLGELRFAASILAKDLADAAGLEAATEYFVPCFAPSLDAETSFAALLKVLAGHDAQLVGLVGCQQSSANACSTNYDTCLTFSCSFHDLVDLDIGHTFHGPEHSGRLCHDRLHKHISLL